MVYKNYLVIANKRDRAGMNIATQLSQFGNYKTYLVDDEILDEDNLDLEKINKYDFVIFASKHKSEKKEKTISIHAPGNWRIAEFGGRDRQVCRTSALFMKRMFEKLNENAKKYRLRDYKITMECTHHGPLIDKPCIFAEIGSTEIEWGDKIASFVVARTISEMIINFKENPYHEIALGIGGPHYCPSFNRIQGGSNIAVSHVIPQYALPLTDDMIRQAIDRTEEEIDFILLDWKGLGSAEHRQEVLALLDRLHINYKKTNGLTVASLEPDEDKD